ncbi:MAG: helix-turn-helix domain-containing protein, partial [Caldimonas sp.]
MHPRLDSSFDTIRALPVAGKGSATPLVPAVSRALALLERLAGAREPMSLARLAAELALPKSSVHGLCNTLVSFGYLRRQPDGTFLIGPRVMGLAEAFVSGTDVAQEFNALWTDSGS